MKTTIFFCMCVIALAYMIWNYFRRKPSMEFRSVDAIVPAYNEGPCLEHALRNLLANPYVNQVIVVNDGSTDDTSAIMHRLAAEDSRVVAVDQANTGKGGALMHGLKYATAKQVYLSDADTYLPPDGGGLGHMLAEIAAGADAVGGIPSSDLSKPGLLPYMRATVKMPMIMMKRTFQQLLGGAPFIISGACGMFKTEVLRKHPFSDRTKVEDLDMTWTLVANGYKVRQANRCIAYPQECYTIKEEWRRWRRWIVGYSICMRLHWRLLFTRFGLFSILPMVGLVLVGIVTYSINWTATTIFYGFPQGVIYALFPLLWVAVVSAVGLFSAIHHRKFLLFPLASLAVFYVLLAYTVWLVHGFKGFFTGREPARDKPTRYAYAAAE